MRTVDLGNNESVSIGVVSFFAPFAVGVAAGS